MPYKFELSGMQAVRSINSFHIHNWIHGIYCILLVEPAHSNSPVSVNLFLQLDTIRKEACGKPKLQSPLIRAYSWTTPRRVGLVRSSCYATIVIPRAVTPSYYTWNQHWMIYMQKQKTQIPHIHSLSNEIRMRFYSQIDRFNL